MDRQVLSIHRWDVLLPVTFRGHCPSTNHNSIVQLPICLPRRDLLLEQASLFQTSSPVFTVFVFQSVSSSKSPTEQWMAVIQCTCRPTFTPVADMPARMRLRSSTSDQLIVSSYNLATVGRRAFPVSAANLWNSIPAHVASAPSFTGFRLRLEFSLPALLLLNYLTLKSLHSVVDLTVTLVSGYIKNVVDDDDDDDTSLISAEVPLRVIRCNYHTRALRHVRKHLTTETIQTIACSIISSRVDYCNSLLYGAPVFSRREATESSEQRRQSYAIIANVSVPDHY